MKAFPCPANDEISIFDCGGSYDVLVFKEGRVFIHTFGERDAAAHFAGSERIRPHASPGEPGRD
jgi:hypothetical protein